MLIKKSIIDDYLKDMQNINFEVIFDQDDGGDLIYKTIFIESGIELIACIIIDNSLFAINIVKIAELSELSKKYKLLEVLNDISRKYKNLYFYIDETNSILCKNCYVSTDESFDASICFALFKNVIQVSIEVLPKIMQILWG